MTNLEIVNAYAGTDQVEKIYLGADVIYSGGSPAPVYSAIPLTLEITSSGTLFLKATDVRAKKTIEYKLNDGNWTSMTTSTTGTTWNVVAGDILQLRGDNLTYGYNTGTQTSGAKYNTLSGSTAGFVAYGNILSMRDSTGFTTASDIGNFYMTSFFRGCTGLTDASNLIFPDFASAVCYANMFAYCSNLTTTPILPATDLTGCLWCYNAMFRGTNITTAPELPATTLAQACYADMFRECTSLTESPILAADTLALYSYQYMFYGCSSLSKITCLATNITNATSNWVYGVAANGTFTKDPNMSSWETGINGIPTNWTVVDYAPAITALTITSPQFGATVHTGDQVQVYYEPTGSSVNLQYSVDTPWAGSISTAGTITVDTDWSGARIIVEDTISNLTADTVCDFSTSPIAGTYDVVYVENGMTNTDTFSNGEIPNNEYRYRIGIESVVIGDGITQIGTDDFSYVFVGCSSLTSITIGSGVTYIGGRAFENVENLHSVTIPASVTGIGTNCFYNFDYGDEIIFESTTPISLSMNENGDLGDPNSGVVIYVPSSAVSAYQQAWPWYNNNIQGY